MQIKREIDHESQEYIELREERQGAPVVEGDIFETSVLLNGCN